MQLLFLILNKRTSIYDHWNKNKFLESQLKGIISENKLNPVFKYMHLHDNQNINEMDKIFKIKK